MLIGAGPVRQRWWLGIMIHGQHMGVVDHSTTDLSFLGENVAEAGPAQHFKRGKSLQITLYLALDT